MAVRENRHFLQNMFYNISQTLDKGDFISYLCGEINPTATGDNFKKNCPIRCVAALIGVILFKKMPNIKPYQNFSVTSMPNEEWRDITGYEGRYQISNFGRVKSLARKGSGCRNEDMILKQTIRTVKHSPTYSKLAVFLRKDGRFKNFLVHRLVANAFIGDEDKEIDHIDGNPQNNYYLNLRYVSHRENLANPITREKRSALSNDSNFKNRIRLSQPHAKKIKATNCDNLDSKVFPTIAAAAAFFSVVSCVIKSHCAKRTPLKGYTLELINK